MWVCVGGVWVSVLTNKKIMSRGAIFIFVPLPPLLGLGGDTFTYCPERHNAIHSYPNVVSRPNLIKHVIQGISSWALVKFISQKYENTRKNTSLFVCLFVCFLFVCLFVCFPLYFLISDSVKAITNQRLAW